MFLQRLTSLLGASQAALELKWMKQYAAKSKIPLADMVARRMKDEPLQYILGTQPFGSLEIRTRAPTLIPRPETEEWTFKLSKIVQPTLTRPISLLDIGTGTGCIPLLLCHLWPKGTVSACGVDISDDALTLARENAALHDIPSDSPSGEENTFQARRANILQPDFATYVSPPYDVVTSNPPYITFAEFIELPKSISQYEDPKALFGGPTEGLDFYYAISRVLATDGFIRDNAVVALEIGDQQGEQVKEMLDLSGRFRRTEIWKDVWKMDRTVVGWAR